MDPEVQNKDITSNANDTGIKVDNEPSASSISDVKEISTNETNPEQSDGLKDNILQAQAEIVESSENIKSTVVDGKISNQDSKSEVATHNEYIKSELYLQEYEGYCKTLEQLLFEIEGCKATCNHKGNLNKSGKNTLKTAQQKLNQYENIIKGKKTSLEQEYNSKNILNIKNPDKSPLKISISENEIDTLKNERFQWKLLIEEDIKAGQTGKFSNKAPFPNQSIEQTKRGNRVEIRYDNAEMKLNEALQDAAFLRCIDNNEQVARELLQAIANNTLTDAQITFCQTNSQQLSPYFQKYGMTDQVYHCIQTRGGRYNNSTTYGNIDGKTAYKIGGVPGLLNNLMIKAFPNAKPNQVSTITGIATTVGVFAAIFGIGKWIFSKDKEGKRHLLGKAAILGSIDLIPRLLTGESGYSILGDILSGKADFDELGYRFSNCLWFMNDNNKEVYDAMAPGILGMSLFPKGTTIGNITELQNTFLQSDEARKIRYSTTYNRLNKNNSNLAIQFQQKFSNANKYNEEERHNFLASIGVNDNTPNDIDIFEQCAKLTDKKSSFALWKQNQGKKEKSEFKKQINDYINQPGEFNPDDIDSRRFEEDKTKTCTDRPEDITNREKLTQQVKNLGLNPDKEKELTQALINFYDEKCIDTKPNPESNFSLSMDENILVLTSHFGQKTKINLDTKTLCGFGNENGNNYEIPFSDLSELINTADLTNKILSITKGKTAKGKEIFQYKFLGGTASRKSISFNDAALLSWDTDTRIISTRRWGESSKFPTINNHLDKYADYLSQEWIKDNKVDLTSYTYIKDMGIDFTNKEEADGVESRLKDLSENKLSESKGCEGGNPFSISSGELKFKHIDNDEQSYGSINNFIDIKNNKDKFLTYINDPTHKIFGRNIL